MVKKRPKDDGALLNVLGVGETKLARYGFEFLSQIRQWH